MAIDPLAKKARNDAELARRRKVAAERRAAEKAERVARPAPPRDQKTGAFIKNEQPAPAPPLPTVDLLADVPVEVLQPLLQTQEKTSRAKCCWCEKSLVTILDGTIWRCPSLNCFARCLAFAIITEQNGKPNYLFIPLPKQAAFFEAVLSQVYRRILFGGAAGVSKSHGMRWLAHYLCLKYPGFKVLLLRRKFPQLEESHLSRVEPEALQLGAVYMRAERLVRYTNQSRLKFGHCAEKGDEVNYLSDEYDLILFDEETTFEESQIVLISSRARTSRTDWKPMVAGGTNPGGPSAPYCISHFLNKNPDPKQYPHYRPADYCYIAGTLDDNPYLNESYELSLDDLPTELREAYRFGNWEIFPGQYFKEWRRAVHTAELIIPAKVNRFCAIDWGYAKPGVCLWFAMLPDGDLYVEDEYVFVETIAAEVAKTIVQRNKARDLRPLYYVADPAMWIRSGDTGESIAETFQRNRVPVRQAKNERVNGWQRLRHWLKWSYRDDHSIVAPHLRVSGENCPYLCRTLPLLQSDLPHKPEDVDTTGEDHAADTLRYGVMSRPYRTDLSAGPRPLGSAGELFDKLREENAA